MVKNILFLAHDTSLFGANQSLINMIKSIRNKNLNYVLVVPDNGPICEKLKELDIHFTIINYKTEMCSPNKDIFSLFLNMLRRINKIILNFFALIKLKKILLLNNIDCIHSNSSVLKIGLDLALKTKTKHVWHIREYIYLDHGAEVFGGINHLKMTLKKSDKVICISKGIANFFKIDDVSSVIYNAVRQKGRDFPIIQKENYFLYCGSLALNKGIEDAIIAFQKVSDQNKNIKLLIAGTGIKSYEEYLQNMVVNLGIQNQVVFLGFRTDTDELMSKALAFLMTSKNEALGRVTIEAMFNFCPIIGFNNAGTAEIINNQITGLLYKSVTELSELMLKVINKEVNIEPIILNAYNFASENFTEEVFGKKLMKIYQ